ncbi:MAG: tetratricopeptide repeat protein [Deltaproteobacteria bacterium]|nr:tetratricopeptide repeat protein [Deltaproteobacteria bacterium]
MGDARGSTRTLAGVAAALVVLTFVAYQPALQAGFLTYDDPKYVTENPVVQLGLTRESVTWAFAGIHDANWIPLVWVSLMADYALFGLEPGGYHATNLLLHMLSTLLLLLALRRMTGELWRPAFVAGVFALHPLHVQSVAWVAERKDALSAVFWMATLLAWARYRERPGLGRYAAVFVALSLSLLAKATAVTLPFVLLLLDHWPGARFRDPTTRSAEFRRAVLEKVPLFIPVAAACLATLLAQSQGGAVTEHFPLATRVGHAFVAWGFYLEKTLWPASLSFFHRHPELAFTDPRVLGSAALVGAATVGLAFAAFRRRAAAPSLVGWLWFIGTLVPMIGFVQVGAQGMADRYMYLPLVGLAILVAWWPGLHGGRARAAGIVATAALLALTAATRVEAGHWHDSERLFRRAIEVDADNFIAHYELARLLNSIDRPAEAERHAAEAVRLIPTWSDAYLNLGAALEAQGRHAEAEKALRRALSRNAGSLAGRHLLVQSLIGQERFVPARNELGKLLREQPGDLGARMMLADLDALEGDPEAAWQGYATVCQLVGATPDGVEAARRLIALVAGWPEASENARNVARQVEPWVRGAEGSQP